MNSFLKRLVFAFVLFNFTFKLSAQQGAAASGGDAKGAGGSVSYSIGQTDYMANTGTSGSVNQGLQQPYEIQILTGIEQTGIRLSCAVYPNPTSDFIILNVQGTDINSGNYELFDSHDKLIRSQKVVDEETRIPLTGLPDGIYLLRLTGDGQVLKSFRIIKNQ
jgi:hypothetical protein